MSNGVWSLVGVKEGHGISMGYDSSCRIKYNLSHLIVHIHTRAYFVISFLKEFLFLFILKVVPVTALLEELE
jgi:hypothetical protein